MLYRPSGDDGITADPGSPKLDDDEFDVEVNPKICVEETVHEPPSPVSDDPLVLQLDALAAMLDPAESLAFVDEVSRHIDSSNGPSQAETDPSGNFVNAPRSSVQLREAPKQQDQQANAQVEEDVIDDVSLDPSVFASSATEYLINREGMSPFQRNQVASSLLPRFGVNIESSNTDKVASNGEQEPLQVDVPSPFQEDLAQTHVHMSQWRLRGLQYGFSDEGQKDVKPLSKSASIYGENAPRKQVKLDGGSSVLSSKRIRAEELMMNPYVKALRSQREEVQRSMDLSFVPTAESLLATERTDSLAILRVSEVGHREPTLGFLCTPEPCAPEPCSYYLIPEPCSGLDAVNAGVAALSTEELCEVSSEYYQYRSYTHIDNGRHGGYSVDDTAESSRSTAVPKDSSFVRSLPFDLSRAHV